MTDLNRLGEVLRTEQNVDLTIWRWFPKQANDAKEKRSHYRSIWNQLVAEAKQDDEDVYTWPVTVGGLRITMVFLENVYLSPASIGVRELIEKASVRLDDYFLWEKGKFGSYCKVLEKRIAKRQMQGYFKDVLKTLDDMAKEKNLRACETLLKAMGRLNGEVDEREGLKIEVVEKYIVDGVKPVEAEKVEIKIQPEMDIKTDVMSKAKRVTRPAFKAKKYRTHDASLASDGKSHSQEVIDEGVDAEQDSSPSV